MSFYRLISSSWILSPFSFFLHQDLPFSLIAPPSVSATSSITGLSSSCFIPGYLPVVVFARSWPLAPICRRVRSVLRRRFIFHLRHARLGLAVRRAGACCAHRSGALLFPDPEGRLARAQQGKRLTERQMGDLWGSGGGRGGVVFTAS